MYSTLTTDNNHASLLHSRRSFCVRAGAIATVSMPFGWLSACTPPLAAVSDDTPPDADSGTAGPMWVKNIGLLVTVNRSGEWEFQKGSNIREELSTYTEEEQENRDYIEERQADYCLPRDEAALDEFDKVALVIVTTGEIISVVGEKVERQWRWLKYTTQRDAGTAEPPAARDAAITIVVTTDTELRFVKDAAIEPQRIEEYDEISGLECKLDAEHLLQISFRVYVSNPSAKAWWHDKTGGTPAWGQYTIGG